ncbi:MAG TPA: TetR/AcrR family transcriptional regulator [Steroidobacteraceae bacterium]
MTAAQELFYEEGTNTVGIERVIERAGVAKASLYNTFGSKEELVRSYLAARHEARNARITTKLKLYNTPRERLLGVFDAQSDLFAEPTFRGCAFVRASAEMRPESSAKGVCENSRAWLRTLFTDLAKDAGANEPESLARQLLLLYDGASISAQMDGDRSAAATARAAASILLDAATSGR